LSAARVLVQDKSTALRIVGFLAQQAAEKALKAGLLATEVPVPKIHGLRQLHRQFRVDNSPEIDDDDLDLLDPWVIDGRNAADLPDVMLTKQTTSWRPRRESSISSDP
jgi:HEPN domain-containing protein